MIKRTKKCQARSVKIVCEVPYKVWAVVIDGVRYEITYTGAIGTGNAKALTLFRMHGTEEEFIAHGTLTALKRRAEEDSQAVVIGTDPVTREKIRARKS